MHRTEDDTQAAFPTTEPRAPWPAGWTPAHVIEVLEPLAIPARARRLQEGIERRVGSVTLVLDAPHDPHNGAAILRSADAFGLPEIHVVPRDETFRVGRTVARGAERWVDVIVHPTPEEAIERLRARAFTLVGTHPSGELVPSDLAHIPRVALLFGNEHAGLRESLAQACDRTVRIPMRGFVESLNVSVAAAVLLENATAGRDGDLSARERQYLYAKALFRSVPRAEDVLEARGTGILRTGVRSV
jgi:tRNA (guanosine-2'-O-)-methyltransferase